MAVAATLIIFITVLWMYYLWSRRKFYAFALKTPGPLGFPLIGILHKIYNFPDALYELPKIVNQYKVKTLCTWVGPYLMFYTMDGNVAEAILNSPSAVNKSKIYTMFNDAIGEGLLTSDAPTWNNTRKLLNPCFSYKILQSFFVYFNNMSRSLCDHLEKSVGTGEINLRELILSKTLKLAVATTMGIKTDSSGPLLKYFERLLMLTVKRALNPLLKIQILFRRNKIYKPFLEAQKVVTTFVYELVISKIKLFEQRASEVNNNSLGPIKESVDVEKSKNIFIDQVIKMHQKNEFTFNNVISESNLMIFAAFETSATSLYSCLMCLAMHPQYQEKVFEEIITNFPDKEFDVKIEDLKDLVYLDMCINETLRVLATVPLIARECSKDLAISKDMVIPKGTQILIDIFNIHRDTDIWGPTARTFNPEHCLPANLADKKISFLPFSKGPRNCIGWQYARLNLKVSMVQVLRKYHLTTKARFEDLKFVENITLTYKTIPTIEVHRR